MNMRYAKRSEDTEQINVVSWAGWNMNRYPELKWLFHVPNGGSRNRAEAVKFKQMGVKAGVSDLCLPYPKGSYCGLFVEMKFGNNRQQDTQKEFLADMTAAGHFVATCYSAEEAIKVIEEYQFVGCGTHGEKSEHEHPEQQHPQGRENQELRRKNDESIDCVRYCSGCHACDDISCGDFIRDSSCGRYSVRIYGLKNITG